MRLTALTIEGFRSIRQRHDLEFAPGCYYLLGENTDAPTANSNAAGKTTLIAAICWALYGRIHTGSDKDAIIHWDADEAKVSAVFDNDLEIVRSKKRGKAEALTLVERGRPFEGDLKIAQARLNSIVGVSEDLFYSSVWIGRDSKAKQFLAATAAERMGLLEEIVANDLYAKARTLAERKRKTFETELAISKAKCDELARQEDQRRRDLLAAQARFQQATEVASAAQQARANKQSRLKEEIQGILGKKYDRAENVEYLMLQVQDFDIQLSSLTVQMGKLSQQANLHVAEACPTCKRPFDPADVTPLRHQKDEATAQMRPLTEKVDHLKADREKVQSVLQRYRQQTEAQKADERRLAELRRDLGNLAEHTDESGLSALQDTVRDIKAAILGIQKTLAEYQKAMAEAAAEIPKYKFWENGFGTRGIRNLLMDDVRTVLQHHVGAYCRMLCGDQMTITMPTGDRFEIVLAGPKGPVKIEDFSTGEAWRANLCVLLSLRKALQFMGSTRLDMLLLDDLLGDLDEAGSRAVVDCAAKLSQEFGLVFVTVPRMVENIPEGSVMTVEKRNSESTIRMGV